MLCIAKFVGASSRDSEQCLSIYSILYATTKLTLCLPIFLAPGLRLLWCKVYRFDDGMSI